MQHFCNFFYKKMIFLSISPYLLCLLRRDFIPTSLFSVCLFRGNCIPASPKNHHPLCIIYFVYNTIDVGYDPTLMDKEKI